jgi:hypothetical protein
MKVNQEGLELILQPTRNPYLETLANHIDNYL